MNKIREMISDVEVVSFDIFDTLIVRLYQRPTDLFLHLEESMGIKGFKEARILAEESARKKAKKNNIHEVTLSQIYDELHASYQYIIEKEVELELLMCKANLEMKEVFDFAVKSGKRIFISSDMYLPKTVVIKILENAEYKGYEKLFLSSDTFRSKATGEMYEDIIKAANVNPNKILHVGDNFLIDYEHAKKMSLKSFLYEPIRESYGANQNSSYFALLNKYSQKEVSVSILQGMITLDSLRHPEKDYWQRFGYKYGGLLMVSYCQWLKKQFDKEGIKKAYFMLRDGYIVKHIFNLLYPDFETCEVYGSRRMYLFARMEKYKDIKEYITALIEGVTYKALYDRLSIDHEGLYHAYIKAFPEQEEPICETDDIHRFMEENENVLLEIAQQERNELANYLNSIKVFEGKNAVVDLGWRCSMLKGLQSVCEKSRKQCNLYGYYLGTHPFSGSKLHVEAFGINNGKPDEIENPIASMNFLYIIDILELIFTAPHQSVLKIKEDGNDFTPIYQTLTLHEQERIDISGILLQSITDFTKEYMEIMRYFPVSISPETALLPMKYFNEFVSPYDRKWIASVFVFPGVGDDPTCFPLSKNGRGRVALINPWENVQGAESEALIRIATSFRGIGVDCVIINSQGYLLDDNQLKTDTYIDSERVDYVITFNYETPKLLNCFYYHTLWSPPEMALRLEDYTTRLSNNLEMNDDYLIYWHGTMEEHIQSVCFNKPRSLEHASSLVASFPLSSIIKPKLDDPYLFYCGMNWEKADGVATRHEGLFKLLDDTGKVRFFGPERVKGWGKIKPWDGYKCYHGSIPFDGFSILKEINQCGVCLVLSSDIHRRAGAATNRTYEACAAGAVIISDDNEFMLHYFRDAALFITYNKNNPKDTFTQIMEKYDWVISHKEEALELAKKAQQIFKEKFVLDVQLRCLIENHPQRMNQLEKDMFAKNIKKKVLVTYVLNTQFIPHIIEYLEKVFKSIQNQYYVNIKLAIAADKTVYDFVREYSEMHCASAKVFPMDLFDNKNSKRMSDGIAIRKLQSYVQHDYFTNINAKEFWFYDHISSLVRTMEDEGTWCAYSGSNLKSAKKIKNTNFFGNAGRLELFDNISKTLNKTQKNAQTFPVPGQFLFDARAHEFLPDYLFSCLDGKEHYAYANILKYKYNQKLSFSRRVTLSFSLKKIDDRNIIMSNDLELRFIQQLITPFLPDSTSPGSSSNEDTRIASLTTKTLSNALLALPLKTLIKLRYLQYKMRKHSPETNKYKEFEQKYTMILNRYNDFWREG